MRLGSSRCVGALKQGTQGQQWQGYSPKSKCRPRIGRKGLGTTMVVLPKLVK